MGPEFWLQVVIAVAAGVGSALAVYVSIRVDLAVTRYKAEQAKETAEEAHKRLDSCMQGCSR